MTRPLVVCDLDRTLIYSLAAVGDDPPALCCVEQHLGRDVSFITDQAAAHLATLRQESEFVPCTTRTREQLARVRLPGVAPGYAIAANGGHLLLDGASDPSWQRVVRARLRQSAPLAEVHAKLCVPEHEPWLLRQRIAEDLFCYGIVDRAALPEGLLAELADWTAARGWTVSLQGRKLYFVPRELTKSAAATELAERLGSTVVLAAGDSLLDTDLLRWADQAVRPRHGELELLDWTRPGLHVTAASGVRAGEELLGWLAEQADTYLARA
ncbi:MAG: HAD family hydrolase [Geodermatophilaceae bacterium]|nr:HAD family hydrolase [Geodermatophilaceae bacterium]MDQ3455325.1 HAD family hydrolase [Actinomycetota bacterium]